MTFSSILSFSVDSLSQYCQSQFFQLVFLPVFCLAIVIMLLRVVKFIVQSNF